MKSIFRVAEIQDEDFGVTVQARHGWLLRRTARTTLVSRSYLAGSTSYQSVASGNPSCRRGSPHRAGLWLRRGSLRDTLHPPSPGGAFASREKINGRSRLPGRNAHVADNDLLPLLR